MKRLYFLATLLVLSVIVSCNKDVDLTADYLNISRSSYTFSNIEDSIYVKVKASGDWIATADQTWITVGEKQGDSILVNVSKNDQEDFRRGKVTFVMENETREFAVEQMPKAFNGRLYEFPLNGRGAVSPGGKFAAYLYWELSLTTGEYTYLGKKLNLETGEEFEIPSESYDGMSYYQKIQAISDDGRTIVYSDDTNEIDAIYVDDQKVEMDVPSGYKSPIFAGMTGDGSIIVGTVRYSDRYGYVPVLWRNGVMEFLEMPEYNSAGGPLQNGVIVRGCSQDGSVIYGSEWDFQGVVYWRNGKLYYPGMDYMEGDSIYRIYMYASYFAMSPNGKYIAASYAPYFMDPVAGTPTWPVLINTETDESVIFEDDQALGGAGLTVNNEGILFGGAPATGMTNSIVYDFQNGLVIPVSEWMKQKHGITLSDSRKVYYTVNDRIYYGAQLVQTGVGVLSPEYVLVLD